MAGGGLSAPYGFKGGTYPGTGGTCSATLNASATCTMVITFSPTVGGTHNATVSLAYDDGVIAQSATRDLTGIAVAPASISISDGATFNFGTIPTTSSADKVFTLTNSGDVTATTMAGTGLSAPYSFKGGTYPGTGGTCGNSLAGASATCTIVVTFNPTANGSTSSTINVTYFDGAASQTASRPVQGTGAPPATLTISNGLRTTSAALPMVRSTTLHSP